MSTIGTVCFLIGAIVYAIAGPILLDGKRDRLGRVVLVQILCPLLLVALALAFVVPEFLADSEARHAEAAARGMRIVGERAGKAAIVLVLASLYIVVKVLAHSALALSDRSLEHLLDIWPWEKP